MNEIDTNIHSIIYSINFGFRSPDNKHSVMVDI